VGIDGLGIGRRNGWQGERGYVGVHGRGRSDVWWKCAGALSGLDNVKTTGMKRAEVRRRTGGDCIRLTDTPNCEWFHNKR
jgi:hypothetical protein